MNKSAITLAAVLCGFTLPSHAQLYDPSLVAWYKFDESAGAAIAANSVAGSSSGAIQSGVTTGLAGISGNAYQFNGVATTGFVDMGNASFLSLLTSAGQLTFSAWINTTDTAGNRNTVLSAGNTTPYRTYTDLGVGRLNDTTPTPGELVATARNRPTGTADVGDQATGILDLDNPINDGQWHHIAMTVNTTANEIVLYVDGVQRGTQTMTTDAISSLNYFQIGRLTRNNSTTGSNVQHIDPYLGLIDDVQIYDAALTAGQIAWLHDNPGQALAAVPEPAEWSILVAGGLAFIVFGRRKRTTTCA